EGRQLRRPLAACPRQRLRERVKLLPAADQLRRCVLEDVDTEARARAQDLPRRDRLRLALRRHELWRTHLEDVGRGATCRLVDENAIVRRRCLQPRRGVDDVAAGHALALTEARVEAAQRLAGRDLDSYAKVTHWFLA